MKLVWISQDRNILNRVLYFFCHCDMIIGKNREVSAVLQKSGWLKRCPSIRKVW